MESGRKASGESIRRKIEFGNGEWSNGRVANEVKRTKLDIESSEKD